MKLVSRLGNPIEWSGMKFRSKLESLVAQELVRLKIQFVHELEGFTDGETCYLPDFYLPQQDCLLEVKPREFLSEVESKRRLIERIGKQYVVVDYACPDDLVPLLMYGYATDCDPRIVSDNPRQTFYWSDRCDEKEISLMQNRRGLKFPCPFFFIGAGCGLLHKYGADCTCTA
jgi:hypothetical protein